MRPYIAPSPLPYGVPDFRNVDPKKVRAALLEGMEGEKKIWRKVADDPNPPTLANTVVPVDLGDAQLERAASVFFTMLSSVGGKTWENIQKELAPKFASHSDDFWLSEAIYKRYLALAGEDLDEESAWLVEETITSFRLSGINLDEKGKSRLRALNEEEAKLSAAVESKITAQLQQTGSGGDDIADLEGLPEEQIQKAQEDGKKHGYVWWLPAANYSQPPAIASLAQKTTRAKVLRDSVNRGFAGGEDVDTRKEILQLTRLRKERATLLGFESHADLVLAEETAPNPEAAIELLETVAAAAKRKLDEEAGAHREQAEGNGETLGAEDWLFYEAQAKAKTLGLDAEELRAYFPLMQVVEDGVFYAATKVYGLEFLPREDIVGWAPGVLTWQVNAEDGRPIGLFMADFYARPGKSGGAWMSQIKSGCGLAGTFPIVTNNTNFTEQEGKTLLTWDQVETLFHEFGHALHGLLSTTFYCATAGTSVPRDFVEVPSQLNEMWAYEPEVLANFARHHETGEPLNQEAVDKLASMLHFGQAFSSLEYVQAAIIDQAWHGETAGPADEEQVARFEREALASHGVDHGLVWPRYRTPYFSHNFAGGYDAAYYSYMWSEAMVAGLEGWVRKEGSDLEGYREKGAILAREILSRGNSRPPLSSFMAVTGSAPDAHSVVLRRGL